MLALVALLAASLFPHAAIHIAQEATVEIHATVVIHELFDEEGEDLQGYGPTIVKTLRICSGFVAYQQRLDPITAFDLGEPYVDLVVTARHCTIPEESVGVAVELHPDHVDFKDQSEHPILGTARGYGNDDIAFFAVPDSVRRPYAYLAPRLPAQGDELFVYGMPLGQDWSLSPATMMVDHHRFFDDDPRTPAPTWEHNTYLIACPACGGGDSGGPVFNTKGQVVGIVSAGGPNAQTLMVPLETLRAYLKGIGDGARIFTLGAP